MQVLQRKEREKISQFIFKATRINKNKKRKRMRRGENRYEA
jgi:hypothetical protein